MTEDSAASEAEPEEAPSSASTLAWVREAIGDRLLAYVLGCSDGQLSVLHDDPSALSAERASVLTVFEFVREHLPPQFTEGDTVRTAIQAWTAQVQDDGRTVARTLRAQSGAVDDLIEGEDDLERAFVLLAEDTYPAMLLPLSTDARFPYRDFTIHLPRLVYSHPARKAFEEAALADAKLAKAFAHDQENSGRYAMIYTNSGWGGSLQLLLLPQTLLESTWRRVKHTPVTPEIFVAEALQVLKQVRSLFGGEVQPIPAKFAFTGVLMPEDARITVKHGTVRPTSEAERELAPESLRQQLSTTDESGNQVFIGYDGDIVYEYQFPYKLRASKQQLGDATAPFPDDMRPPEDFEYDSLLIRFSLMLAVARRDRVQLVQTWRNYDDPLRPGTTTGWNDPRQAAGLMPARLTEEEVAAWQQWYDRLNTPEVARIELALSRILRAVAERRDPADVLIDAVIAWERFFGHKEEATLRVTLSLARLLADTAEQRAVLKAELGKIYALRSNIVHGASALKFNEYPLCQRALEIAIEAVRKLVSERSDILKLATGAERSNALLVE